MPYKLTFQNSTDLDVVPNYSLLTPTSQSLEFCECLNNSGSGSGSASSSATPSYPPYSYPEPSTSYPDNPLPDCPPGTVLINGQCNSQPGSGNDCVGVLCADPPTGGPPCIGTTPSGYCCPTWTCECPPDTSWDGTACVDLPDPLPEPSNCCGCTGTEGDTDIHGNPKCFCDYTEGNVCICGNSEWYSSEECRISLGGESPCICVPCGCYGTIVTESPLISVTCSDNSDGSTTCVYYYTYIQKCTGPSRHPEGFICVPCPDENNCDKQYTTSTSITYPPPPSIPPSVPPGTCEWRDINNNSDVLVQTEGDGSLLVTISTHGTYSCGTEQPFSESCGSLQKLNGDLNITPTGHYDYSLNAPYLCECTTYIQFNIPIPTPDQAAIGGTWGFVADNNSGCGTVDILLSGDRITVYSALTDCIVNADIRCVSI